LILWLAVGRFHSDVPAIVVSRSDAEQTARAALAAQGTQLDSSWTVLSRVSAQPSEEDTFVWRRGGAKSYQVLLGSYLPPPHWVVRFARFQGDVAQRAEEYQVAIAGDSGRAYRIRHQLPEAAPGATLTEDQARGLALTTIERDFGVTEKDVSEISAEAKKLPARGDWSVEYKDNRDYGLPEGEPRLAVEIAGDRISDSSRYIHVPEEWERNERNRRNLPDIFGVAEMVMMIGIVVTGMIVAAIRWSRGQGFSTRALRWIGGAVLLVAFVGIANNWKTTTSTLLTAQPYAIQAGMALVVGVISAIVLAGAFGLASGFLAVEYSRVFGDTNFISIGISLGFIIAGFRALATALTPLLEPKWPDFSAAGDSVPLIAAALNPFTAFVTLLLIMSLLFLLIQYVTHRWKFHRATGVVLFLVMGLLLEARTIETISSWLAGGALLAAALLTVYVFVIRYDPRVVLPMVAALSALSLLRETVHRAYPSALLGGILAIVVIGIATAQMSHRRA
jgi:hypothetical protein